MKASFHGRLPEDCTGEACFQLAIGYALKQKARVSNRFSSSKFHFLYT